MIFEILFILFLFSNPATHEPVKKPRRKPPVGLKSTANPALPPAKTGKPRVPRKRYNPTEALPHAGPKNIPERIEKKSENTIGTGLNGTGKLKNPPTIINTVKNEDCAIIRKLDAGLTPILFL